MKYTNTSFIPKQAICPKCGKGVSKQISMLDAIIIHNNPNLYYSLAYCDTCNQCYWLVVDTKNKQVVSQQLLYMSDTISSEWVIDNETWFHCGNCLKIHSRPFKKSVFCPDCGSYMINHE